MMTSSEGPIFSLASGPPNSKPTTAYTLLTEVLISTSAAKITPIYGNNDAFSFYVDQLVLKQKLWYVSRNAF